MDMENCDTERGHVVHSPHAVEYMLRQQRRAEERMRLKQQIRRERHGVGNHVFAEELRSRALVRSTKNTENKWWHANRLTRASTKTPRKCSITKRNAGNRYVPWSAEANGHTYAHAQETHRKSNGQEFERRVVTAAQTITVDRES